MAARGPLTAQGRPDLGDSLMVIHDFIARSSDELSLTKGDRVELIERDDEFGDGWFLGRHLGNGNTGLFPEVYTRPTPKSTATPTHPSSTPLSPLPEVAHDVTQPAHAQQTSEAETSSHPVRSASGIEDAPVTLPLSSTKPDSSTPPPASKQGQPTDDLARLNNPSQDSQVLNETLNVINEHITDLRSPASSSALPSIAPDSSSEYSAPLDRMSYIHGDETDEEEDGGHSRSEVESWTPDQAAEFLFAFGVEKHHCDVFRDQEISGEVLLGMDQSSLFIKAFDLGSVGRRLKTWHKIKSLQDEVNGKSVSSRRSTRRMGSDRSSDMTPRTRGRTSTVTSATANPPMTIQTQRLSVNHTPPALTPNSTSTMQESPLRSSHHKRPSAASVRELHHSRRHSSTDYHLNAGATPRLASNVSFPGAADPLPHKKQPSFDRNWNLGSAFAQTSPRPMSSSTGARGATGGSDIEHQDSAAELDRGYFSGTEADGRTRNTIRKRDSAASQSNRGSYAEEQRVRSATALSRHSRYGSVDSFREGAQSAAQKYYGVQPGLHRRTTSTNATEPPRLSTSIKENPSPTVTRLDTSRGSDSSKGPPTPAKDSDWLASLINKPMGKTGGFGMRAISDNLSFDRSKASSVDIKDAEPSVVSPTRTGSTTPSAGASLELESPDMTKSPGTAATNTPAAKNRRKTKKETSAYTRGLLKISPKEAVKDADYSGWMRKKSSNLMTTWKPRFFVLKGRRLAYYYSEDDDSEKGLIDISFHRVLPADNEKLTGLHATITGASLTSPTPDSSEPVEKGDDSIFIFKLTPPRAGLSRAVHFTKPTVHYFAVPNLRQGRLWMAALMKATIDRDDSQPVSSTYQQKTISLAKAKQMRHRPPALMGLEEGGEDGQQREGREESNGLGIFSEVDSGVAGVDRGADHHMSSQSTADYHHTSDHTTTATTTTSTTTD